MNNTQLGWLVTFILFNLITLFCYAYLLKDLRQLILPVDVILPVHRKAAHKHGST